MSDSRSDELSGPLLDQPLDQPLDQIYMDHHATTPVDQRVVDAMLPYLNEKFGNIASQHCFGKAVQHVCKASREQIASLIGCEPKEVYFTSGATESNNLAIKGAAEGMSAIGKHIITCVTEHKAVLDTCAYLENRGFAVTYLPVDQHGQVGVQQVLDAVRTGPVGTIDRTTLLSLMGANNEIGTIHPFLEVGHALKELHPEILFHMDGAQTAGKVPLDVKLAKIDLVSISGHKIYGPKGIGCIYIREDCRRQIAAQMHGGGQERGMRAGTLPIHLCVGLGKAAALCQEEMIEENERLTRLRNHLQQALLELGGVQLNGHPQHRLPGNLNVTVEGVDSELLSLSLKGVAVSSTSACSSSSPQPSYVLKAIGRSHEEAFSSLRFGLGRINTREQVEIVIDRLRQACHKWRRV